MVAIMLVLLMSMAAFALDSGNGWRTRRELVTAHRRRRAAPRPRPTPRAATGCSGVPSTFVTRQRARCDLGHRLHRHDVGAGAAAVTVQAKTPLHYTFAGIIGVGDRDVHSSTTAAYGQPLGVFGLRPLGLCNASDSVRAWLASGMANPFTVTINYGKDAPGDCGANVPGNWGVLDFDGGANSNNDTKEWIENGYPGLVTAPGTVPGDTGAFSNALRNALDTLVSSGQPFQLPVYDSGRQATGATHSSTSSAS